MKNQGWDVHKFGGTSVANADRYRQVSRIMTGASPLSSSRGIVVSAMSGVTDGLIELVQLARTQNDQYLSRLESLKKRHQDTLNELIPNQPTHPLHERLNQDFSDIREMLRGVWLGRTASQQTVEWISGFGEIWSAQFLNAYFNAQGIPSTWLDARTVLTVHPHESSVTVDWKDSQKKIDAWLAQNTHSIVVITGFVASTPEGIPTTLKRNGSDFSASIFGALLNATEITIWTDVDGILTADPRLVPDAVLLEDISYKEATELAYFGAKVVHPSTMAPAVEKKIPIWIRNTFNPTHPGTKIHEKSVSKLTVKGFSLINQIALVNVEGTGMMGVPGVANRLFGALREVNVSVIMISQASSEHSICFAVPQTQAKLTRETVERAFYAELHQGQIESVQITENCSILAAVGDNMVEKPGAAATFFTALAQAGVNVRAIAQGSSERNISAVIDEAQSKKALRAVHSGFYLSNLTVSIGLIGPGLIGSTFLEQLRNQIEKLKQEHSIDIRVCGIMTSTKMLLDSKGIPLEQWKSRLETSSEAASIDTFLNHLQSDPHPHRVLIDCTSSQEIASHYPEWLSRGFHLITPNKKSNSGSMESYLKIREASRAHLHHFLYETTVGAGLPIINTLKDLVKTGDQVLKIEGIFSGTLSFLFNHFTLDRPFSELIREARQKGFTEPDPRDDLSGMDVARKLIILAREMGRTVSLSDVEIESLVPDSLKTLSLDDYWKQLSSQDAEMSSRLRTALELGERLRYVGIIPAEGKPSVRLLSVPESHPFSRITGSDNIVSFTTSRYHQTPLIVQGPGAGPEVTAAGVFADLLRLTTYLGALT